MITGIQIAVAGTIALILLFTWRQFLDAILIIIVGMVCAIAVAIIIIGSAITKAIMYVYWSFRGKAW